MPTWIIRRYRQDEGAPSLSLRYSGQTEQDALRAHFTAYERIAGATYEAVKPGERFGTFVLKPGQTFR